MELLCVEFQRGWAATSEMDNDPRREKAWALLCAFPRIAFFLHHGDVLLSCRDIAGAKRMYEGAALVSGSDGILHRAAEARLSGLKSTEHLNS